VPPADYCGAAPAQRRRLRLRLQLATRQLLRAGAWSARATGRRQRQKRHRHRRQWTGRRLSLPSAAPLASRQPLQPRTCRLRCPASTCSAATAPRCSASSSSAAAWAASSHTTRSLSDTLASGSTTCRCRGGGAAAQHGAALSYQHLLVRHLAPASPSNPLSSPLPALSPPSAGQGSWQLLGPTLHLKLPPSCCTALYLGRGRFSLRHHSCRISLGDFSV
jgi:hypothetical protein